MKESERICSYCNPPLLDPDPDINSEKDSKGGHQGQNAQHRIPFLSHSVQVHKEIYCNSRKHKKEISS